MSFDAWLTFTALWFLLGLPIGPNAIATLSASARDGLGAGLAVACGITAAGLVHAVLASLGFGTLLAAWPETFAALRLLGAAYLAWLGIRTVLRAGSRAPTPPAPGRSVRQHVRHGALVSLSNPKAILTYMAVFPTALDPAAPLAGQMAVLLPTALTVVFAIYGGHAVVGVGVGRFLLSPVHRQWFDRVAGGLFVASAGALAASALRR